MELYSRTARYYPINQLYYQTRTFQITEEKISFENKLNTFAWTMFEHINIIFYHANIHTLLILLHSFNKIGFNAQFCLHSKVSTLWPCKLANTDLLYGSRWGEINAFWKKLKIGHGPRLVLNFMEILPKLWNL